MALGIPVMDINGNCPTDKRGSSFRLFVDIVFESFIGNIHLPKSWQDLLGTGVTVLGNMVLQFLIFLGHLQTFLSPHGGWPRYLR